MKTVTVGEIEIMNHNLQAMMNRSVFQFYCLFTNAYQIRFGWFSIADSFKYFYSMVKPVLCYASQIWGYECVEPINLDKFCKNILFERLTTCNNTCLVLGEYGRLPLCTTYYINCIQYWCNLLTMPSHRYLKQCYNMLKPLDDAGRNCWVIKN